MSDWKRDRLVNCITVVNAYIVAYFDITPRHIEMLHNALRRYPATRQEILDIGMTQLAYDFLLSMEILVDRDYPAPVGE